jgi:adenylate cyclase
MATASMDRKLAALLSADVTGYSLLMGENEEATVRTLMTYRQVMSALIREHRGRVVDSPGDNLLAEFASVVDAVQSAVAIQREISARNEGLPLDRRMEFRIGINLGDVIVEGEQVYGDGVNIAARLESLAEPGGICISGTAYDQVEGKLKFACIFEGERTVRNIAKPVRVYRVLRESQGKTARVRARRHGGMPLKRRATTFAVALVILAAGVTSWQLVGRNPALVTAIRAPEATALPLPDKPSIAVLPFINLSQDPEQEYFSDGITEDLITNLSRMSGLFVIARHSTFFYKGKVVKTADVSRELGVRYVLDGSVRKSDGRVRITARLIDGFSGYHLWADRYDRELKGIFSVQDEITQKIVASLAGKLKGTEERSMERRDTDNQEAWDHFIRARELFRQATRQANREAQDLLHKAIRLDPNFARAHATLAATYRRDWVWGWGDYPDQAENQAVTLGEKAVDLDRLSPHAHKELASVYVYQRRYDEAIAEALKAVDLDPNGAEGYAVLAEVLNYAGNPAEAIKNVQTAIRLDPYHSAWYPYILGQAYYLQRNYQEAEKALTSSINRNPRFMVARAYHAAVQWELSLQPGLTPDAVRTFQEKAAEEMAEVRKVNTKPPSERKGSTPYQNLEIRQHLHETWAKAEEFWRSIQGQKR